VKVADLFEVSSRIQAYADRKNRKRAKKKAAGETWSQMSKKRREQVEDAYRAQN
jgi:hypothetical protein